MFTYGFYNSLNGDRKYTAEQMSAIFDGLIRDGIFATIGNAFDITPGEGLEINVDTGKAWFNGTWNINDALMPLSLSPPDVTLSRIDAVILDVNKDNDIRKNSIMIVEGEYSVDPEKPELIKEDPHWQYALAYVTVDANATEILSENIEKMIGQAECPFVTGILQTIDITLLFTQWQGQFDTWFADLQTKLSGDVAANLQRQIDDIYQTLAIMTEHVGLMTVTVLANGVPLSGVEIAGLCEQPNGEIFASTNEDGIAVGYINEGSATIGINYYLDIEEITRQVEIKANQRYTETFNVTVRNFTKITESGDKYRFSPNVSRVDVTVVGGGGGGACGHGSNINRDYYEIGGNGGGGGGVQVSENVSFKSNTPYKAIVGSGGVGGKCPPVDSSVSVETTPATNSPSSGDGGDSSFLGISATGGKGGYTPWKLPQSSKFSGGDPNGVSGGTGATRYQRSDSYLVSGTNGTDGIEGYDSFTTTTNYGGSGGGGGLYYAGNAYRGLGGKGGGGNGANGVPSSGGDSTTYIVDPGENGVNNTGGGGGGGAGYYTWRIVYNQYVSKPARSNGGNGGSGVIAVRMHLILGQLDV